MISPSDSEFTPKTGVTSDALSRFFYTPILSLPFSVHAIHPHCTTEYPSLNYAVPSTLTTIKYNRRMLLSLLQTDRLIT